MDRINLASGAKWESLIGYSRAVRIGNVIEITGTTAIENGVIIGKDDAYTQTKCILDKIDKILNDMGAELKDVIRTRMFVTDITQWQEIGRAHSEKFNDILPATSMVQVSALIEPDMLVEIEATAIVEG